jgi:DNA gyrase subunit A
VVGDGDDVIYISASGNVVRTPAAEISLIGRGTQGVRLVSLAEGDSVASATRAERENGEPDGEGAPTPDGSPPADPAPQGG